MIQNTTFDYIPFESAFDYVATNNLKSEYYNIYDVEVFSTHIFLYNSIRHHMKYSLKGDERSKWDRPGVICLGISNVRRDQRRHAVLAWGCARVSGNRRGIEYLTYHYKVQDPRVRTNEIDLMLSKVTVIVLPANKQRIPRGFFATWWAEESEPPDEDEIDPRDPPDDNFSYSEGSDNRFYFLTPDVLIYQRGYFEVYKNPEYVKKEDALTDIEESAETLFKSGRLLILPTGSLTNSHNDSTLKYILKDYVKLGGTILVLTQQYGKYFSEVVPVPENEFLRSYGWREDQSCLHGSLYTRAVHPVLSSFTKEQVSAAVDGYFDIYPSNSTKLLIRTKNNEPALIMYPYGDNGGHVILTSLYTDWGYGHSQATTEELKLVRDLVTFARNPGLPIPMYNVSQNPTPEISLSVRVKNNTEDPAVTATKVKFKITTPDRSSVLYETEQGLSLTPDGENIITNMSGNML